MNGQTDDRARLMVGIGAAIFSAVQKISAGQPTARVVIGAAHDILDVAGHHHTFDPDNPLRAAVAEAARGADGLTDQERASGMTAASVLGENLNTETMDHTEETRPVAGAAQGEGTGGDFTLPAVESDRRVPGDYIPPDSQRDTSSDAPRNAQLQVEHDAGRERHNLGEHDGRERDLSAGGETQDLPPENEGGTIQEQDPADGGRIQELDPADGGRIQEFDPADGGRIQEFDSADGGTIQGADDAPQQ